MSWVKGIEWKTVGAFEEPTSQPLRGASVALLGGGPSLSPEIAKALQAAHRTILINNSFCFSQAPSLVVAMDRRWWTWHGEQVAAFGHTGVIGLRPGCTVREKGTIRRMKKEPETILTDHRGSLTGRNSGHAAIQLAIHLGAERIYLAGFDMGFSGDKSHWHGGHVIPSSSNNYTIRFRPALEELVKQAASRNISIASITPTQADIPTTDFSAALKDLQCPAPA